MIASKYEVQPIKSGEEYVCNKWVQELDRNRAWADEHKELLDKLVACDQKNHKAFYHLEKLLDSLIKS